MFSKEKAVELGEKLGFEIVRKRSVHPFPKYKETVRKRIKMGLYHEELIAHEEILEGIENYADPSSSLPEAKTIISLAFNYYTPDPRPH